MTQTLHSSPVRTQQIPIAVVGLSFGRYIVRDELASSSCDRLFHLNAVCDLNPARAAQVSREFGVREATLDDLIDDPDVPAIGLFTPPVGRANLVRRIIRAGKHVMTTKPFELDPVAAMDVLEEARALGMAVHMNSPSPFPPTDLVTIAKWRSMHNLGRPVGGTLSTWANYREAADGAWLDDPSQCPAPPLFRLGIYLINDALQIFGEPEEVFSMTSRLFTGRPTADNAQAAIRFKGGALVTIAASFCVKDADYYRRKSTFHFANGTIYRNAGPDIAADKRARLVLVAPKDGHPAMIEEATFDTSSGCYDWQAFHRAVTQGELPPENYTVQVTKGIRVMQAIAKSEQTRRAVILDD